MGKSLRGGSTLPNYRRIGARSGAFSVILGISLVVSACSSNAKNAGTSAGAATPAGAVSTAAAGGTTAAGSTANAAASGGASAPAESTKVNFTLNYLPGGAQAGFMYGKSLGIFQQHGIDLTITPGSGSLTTAELVAQGKVNIGYVDAATAFSVAAKGGAITVVAPILQVNGYAIVSLKSTGIDSVKALAGHSLSIVTGLAPTVLLPAVFASGGVTADQIHEQNMASASQIGAILQHKVDAIVAAGDVQGPQLEEKGQQVNELWYYKNGVPTVGESIVVNNNYLKDHGDVVKQFIAASLDSWVATQKNPQAAADAEAQQFPAEGTAAQELDQIKVDIGLLCAAPGATNMGEVPDEVWQRTQSILEQFKLLPANSDYTKWETTDYLPSSLPSCS
jgi:NitT/TauT family transport system substrate-binding protein